MIRLSIFGPLHVSDKSKKVIYFEGQKELALIAILALGKSQRASREYLADILWSNPERTVRLTSLRKALHRLKQLEKKSGSAFLQSDRRYVSLLPGKVRTDIDEIDKSLRRGKRRSVERSIELVGMPFMETTNIAEPGLVAWGLETRKILVSRLLETATLALAKISEDSDPVIASYLNFILALEPGSVWARARLDRLKAQTNFQNESAAAPHSTEPVSKGSSIAQAMLADKRGINTVPPVFRMDLFPSIIISGSGTGSLVGRDLISQILTSVENTRDFAIRYQGENLFEEGHTTSSFGVDHVFSGTFSLNFSESQNNLSLSLRDRTSGKQVLSDIIRLDPRTDLEDNRDVARRIATLIDSKVRKYYATNGQLSDSFFRKIDNIYEQIRMFDGEANIRAFEIVENLEQEFGESSILYSFRTSLLLQKNLFLRVDGDTEQLLSEAKEMGRRAVELDPWRGLNYRYLSFANSYSGDAESARREILLGQDLTPSDPLQIIATAEVCAFAGDIGGALAFAKQIENQLPALPRYTFGYLANVQFAAGNFEEALAYARQAPIDSMEYQAIRVASLWHLGKKKLARQELSTLIGHVFKRNPRDANLDIQTICDWLTNLAPFANPKIKALHREALIGAAFD